MFKNNGFWSELVPSYKNISFAFFRSCCFSDFSLIVTLKSSLNRQSCVTIALNYSKFFFILFISLINSQTHVLLNILHLHYKKEEKNKLTFMNYLRHEK